MILVTGGAGFIGSNIVAALADRGEEVVVCDRLRSDGKWRNLAKHLVAELVAPEALAAWLGRAPRLRAIVHMGAISATTERDGDLTAATNITLSLALWEWCAAQAVPLIYASSAATYGDGTAGFDDDASPAALARLRPLNLYGWSKHAFDRRVADLIARGRPRPPHWAGLKFFNVYGPNEYHKGPMISVVKRKADEIAAGNPATLFRSHRADIPDGHQARDFIWVGDCVDVVLWLLDHPHASGLYNVGTGRARTYVDLARAVFAAMNRAPEISFVDTPEHLRAQYQYFTQARMERLRAAGYDRTFTPLEDGVATYVRDFLLAEDPYR
ncbi:ADP-glyceromanno-heptose 6-epimerase [Elioraea tepidiphila]|jgi:ADP-L-glycero-D-manno-heptose 6-epimerase|uniref:ADP-glyceromanno-heptose 6-epimerase n=1 Tax=Elioraea tepidiphila TaxID=457934 RepID=UPI00037CACE4|nr:ADP-glyceromanno-heptose 6-epimerase [Elioraea tepidiphila]